jgi:hypothetical protein
MKKLNDSREAVTGFYCPFISCPMLKLCTTFSAEHHEYPIAFACVG